jgi:hypothetical protein
MNANDRPADAPGLGIPTHMIADLELVCHEFSLDAERFG